MSSFIPVGEVVAEAEVQDGTPVAPSGEEKSATRRKIAEMILGPGKGSVEGGEDGAVAKVVAHSAEALNESPQVAILRLDIKELENAISHLERSNGEIREFLKENGVDDHVLSSALEENLVALETKKRRLEEKQLKLEALAPIQQKETPEFLMHKVTSDDTLFGLELAYGVPAASIRRANGMTNDRIYAQVMLKIPNPKYKPDNSDDGDSVGVSRAKMTRGMLAMVKKVNADIGEAEAKFYLEEHEWDVAKAIDAFRRDEAWAITTMQGRVRDKVMEKHSKSAVHAETGARSIEMRRDSNGKYKAE